MFKYNYDAFYNYYTNNANLHTYNHNGLKLKYFKDIPRPTQNKPFDNILPTTYISIRGMPIYVNALNTNSKDLLFTIPTYINGEWWDNHYHFGIDMREDRFSNRSPKPLIEIIYLHKTIQDPNSSGKNVRHCHFRNNITLTTVDDIVCRNFSANVSNPSTYRRMKDVFPFIFHFINTLHSFN